MCIGGRSLAGEAPRALRVLAWPGPDAAALNPYVSILYGGMATGATVTDFSFSPRFLRGGYDVFHVHWPELALNGGGPRVWLRLGLLTAILSAGRLRGTRTVRTVHNLAPHDRRGSLAQRALDALMGLFTDAEIHLQAATLGETPTRRRGKRMIPHPRYERRDAAPAGKPTADGRVLCFGRLRAYKGVEDLLEVWAGQSAWQLSVVGTPDDPTLRGLLERRLPAGDLALGFASEDELDTHLELASLVCLPYRTVTNSGSAFRALTRARPVLLPAGVGSRELQAAVGPAWVHLFEPPLRPADVADALTRTPSGHPDLSAFDPAAVSQATLDFYRQVVRA